MWFIKWTVCAIVIAIVIVARLTWRDDPVTGTMHYLTEHCLSSPISRKFGAMGAEIRALYVFGDRFLKMIPVLSRPGTLRTRGSENRNSRNRYAAGSI